MPFTKFLLVKPFILRTPTHKISYFSYLSNLEIEREINKLKRSKLPGPDNLLPRLQKNCASTISSPLSKIINLSLKTESFPDDWKSAKIILLIHKSASKNCFGNYRPMSLLSELSKVMEKSMHCQLSPFLESNKPFSQNQFGFPNHRSRELAATLLFDDICKVDKGHLVVALFLDLSKAFDAISHSKIIDKLPAYGIKWNQSTDSEMFHVTCGIP